MRFDRRATVQAIECEPQIADAWKRRGQTRAALGLDAVRRHLPLCVRARARARAPTHSASRSHAVLFSRGSDQTTAVSDLCRKRCRT